VTAIGAVSPPGGDFSEPVTQNSLRIAGAFWGLDARLAYSRHFPAINWLTSYTLYLDALKDWYAQDVGADFLALRTELLDILQREDELKKIVQLVGRESLSEPDKLLLDVARTIREDFLRQSAFHEVDAYCPAKKQYLMMRAILTFYHHCQSRVGQVPFDEIAALPGWELLSKMRYLPNENVEAPFEALLQELTGGPAQPAEAGARS
jgi:V/A-type H+-transporting ATPase subunit A